LKPSWGKIAA